MTPEQASLVQDAAGLVAAHLRGDEEGQGVLVQRYASEAAMPQLVDAFVYYLVASTQVCAELRSSSWRSVLSELPEEAIRFLPGVQPDWSSMRQLVADVAAQTGNEPPAMELAPCLEAAYSLSVGVTMTLGEGDRNEALEWALRLSNVAAHEA